VTTALFGIDFTSRPTSRKPITFAQGQVLNSVLRLHSLHAFQSFEIFSKELEKPGPWLGVFDFPFGLPRELVQTLQWPQQWLPLMQHYANLSRAQIREAFAGFCDARPVGSKFAHRATDGPAGSSSSMKWVNPPVAYMMHAGVPLLMQAGAHLPALFDGDVSRVALEGYPGLLAREVLGARSYKSDDKAKQTTQRLIARKDLIEALELGSTRLGLRLRLSHAQRDALVGDASGDCLDAVLCLMQAAWAISQPRYGLPAQVDPIEGWIVSSIPRK
jgi:hypothetical protein